MKHAGPLLGLIFAWLGVYALSHGIGRPLSPSDSFLSAIGIVLLAAAVSLSLYLEVRRG